MIVIEKTRADGSTILKFVDRVLHLPDLYNPIRQQPQITNTQPNKLKSILAPQGIV